MEYRIAMNSPVVRLARRTPFVLAALTLIAILAFAGVSRLVTRLKANERRIAFHAFEAGLTEFNAGHPERALGDYRAALSYDRDNSLYQLSLARALRETGRLDESQSYLINLWEKSPQDSTINLALARLAARRQSIDGAIRYYHNAIYGLWPSDPDQNRRQARLELIEFLLQQNALPQAQAELIALGQALPPDPDEHLTVAKLFVRARDYQNALAQYEAALKIDHKNAAALAGAGDVAFRMGRYLTAQRFLQRALQENLKDDQSRQRLQIVTLVLESDPFLRRISDAERNRRLTAAFAQAGKRLQECAQIRNIVLPATVPRNPAPLGDDLPSLWTRWQAARPELRRLRVPTHTDMPDTLMDLVNQIEQQTAQLCGEPSGIDLALLLISRDREDVDR
jgi:tetratricopeptide (TPR) repeat protein